MNIIGYHLLHQWDSRIVSPVYFFFFNDTATTEIYTLSLHDALPICRRRRDHRRGDRARCGAAWLSHGRGGEGRLRKRHVVAFVAADSRRPALPRAIRVSPSARSLARATRAAPGGAPSGPPARVRVALVRGRAGARLAAPARTVAIRPARQLPQRRP